MIRLAACLLAALAVASSALAKPPVWVVSDRDSEMVLFGSVHLLPSGMDWRPEALDDALKTADDLWFEAPVGEAADREASDQALKLGALPPGQPLTALLPRRDAGRLKAAAAQFGVDMRLLDTFEPWLAEALLVQRALAREFGAYGDYGVEDVIHAAARPEAERRAFATNAEHIDLLDGMAMDDQVASLRRTLRELKHARKDFTALLNAWMRGDLKWIQREAVEPERREAPASFRRLVTDRNARWTSTLDQRLKGKGRTVVVVGMGHMIGPEGLPSRLRALGYSVKGP